MDNRICPRCGATLPPSAEWEPLDLVEGRAPAYRNRHDKPEGKPGDRKCVVYSGEVAATAKPLGDTAEGLTARELPASPLAHRAL